MLDMRVVFVMQSNKERGCWCWKPIMYGVTNVEEIRNPYMENGRFVQMTHLKNDYY